MRSRNEERVIYMISRFNLLSLSHTPRLYSAYTCPSAILSKKMKLIRLGLLVLLLAVSTSIGEEDSELPTQDVETPLMEEGEAEGSGEVVEIPRPPPDRIDTASGPIAGMEEQSTKGKTFYSFYSIPFAEPPVGDLRFKMPVKVKNWEEVRDCTQKPPMCLQYDFPMSKELLGQEDCLYLNVFTPKPHEENARLPIMVFIHGGGFFAGSSNEYAPHVMMNHDIVLVTIQYRLGMLGFLSTEDKEAPGNYGLRDQTMALSWVQTNAHLFGGDPVGITLFGESAGAASVHFQILSPRAVGLFQKAILMSGSALAPFARGGAFKEIAEYTAKTFNCSTEDGSGELIACLQKVPASDLVPVQQHFTIWFMNPFLLAPRVDEDFVPAEPEILMKNGRHKRINMMSGVTAHEGGLYSIPLFANEGYRAALMLNFAEIGPIALEFSDADVSPLNQTIKIFDHYLHSANIDVHTIDNVTRMFSDRYFTIPHDITSQMHAKNLQRWQKKVYAYELTYRGQRSFSDIYGYGLEVGKDYVTHADDLCYFFDGGYFEPLEKEDDLKVRDIMTNLWANFATYGDPTPDDSLGFKWEPVSKDSYSHLNINLSPAMEEDSRAEIREFWEALPLMQNLLLHPEKVANLTIVPLEEGSEKEPSEGEEPSSTSQESLDGKSTGGQGEESKETNDQSENVTDKRKDEL
ncbi:venom carboxylesterase-6-like [Palaemon carinicauda]|uniref:venom carboxylesterase-6-like n=1 Tax=Palaemon carinicauda TaxID=392227 RepID=UPI0035B5FA4E